MVAMGEHSAIAWCDNTFNPWEGCTKLSPGCKNCYAEARNIRLHHGDNWGPAAPRLLRSPAYWHEPERWNKAAQAAGKRARVFSGSLCDVGEDRPDLVAPRARLIALIHATPWLIWLLLTKRPENMPRLFAGLFLPEVDHWPINVWVGTSTENQEEADRRIPHLIQIPAVKRFLSAEPLLGPLSLPLLGSTLDLIHWVIVGGESNGGRSMDIQWARDVRDHCQEAETPFFFKQLGSRPQGWWKPSDKHGAIMAEWPTDLQLQEVPA